MKLFTFFINLFLTESEPETETELLRMFSRNQ